ncbi:MAG: OmpA/MotB family protein [Planctomycetota bacterium]|jgi:chemotaxis protein MotB
MKKILTAITVSLFALVGSGCVSLDEYNRVAEHLEAEQEANAAIGAENRRKDGIIDTLRADNDKKAAQIKEMRVLQKSNQMPEDDIISKIKDIWGKDMRSSDWDMVQSGGAVGVRMDDRGVLFRSGSWTLTTGTKTKLDKLAVILKDKSKGETFIRVDGHTDSDPVKKLKAKGIQDNVHLSTMRAMAVRTYLVSKGISKDRIFVAGFGEHWAVAEGKSTAAKSKNRRVEIFLGDKEALSIGGDSSNAVVQK